MEFPTPAKPSGVNIRPGEVFNKKFLLHGVDGLNREISKLPIAATVYKTKHSQRLSYPPADIIEQVRRYAEKLHVDVQMLNANVNSNARVS